MQKPEFTLLYFYLAGLRPRGCFLRNRYFYQTIVEFCFCPVRVYFLWKGNASLNLCVTSLAPDESNFLLFFSDVALGFSLDRDTFGRDSDIELVLRHSGYFDHHLVLVSRINHVGVGPPNIGRLKPPARPREAPHEIRERGESVLHLSRKVPKHAIHFHHIVFRAPA